MDTLSFVDIATYLSLFVGIVALFIGSKVIKKKSISQRQTVKNGVGIQVGRDLNVKNKEVKSDTEASRKK